MCNQGNILNRKHFIFGADYYFTEHKILVPLHHAVPFSKQTHPFATANSWTQRSVFYRRRTVLCGQQR